MQRLGGVDPDKVNVGKYKLGDQKIYVVSTPESIAIAECANRAKCVIGQTFDIQFKLHGHGSIRVDAHGAHVTHNRIRYFYTSRSNAPMEYLRRFDDLGQQRGVEYARANTRPRAFLYVLVTAEPSGPKKTREQMDEINRRRNERNARLREQGIVIRRKPRYTGI